MKQLRRWLGLCDHDWRKTIDFQFGNHMERKYVCYRCFRRKFVRLP